MSGTNVVAFGIVLGNKSAHPVGGSSVHVDDVALLHVKALDKKIPASIYIVNSGGLEGDKWESALEIVAKNFPQAVEEGILPNKGEGYTRKLPIDCSKAERVFIVKFKSYEEQVKSVAQHYLELLGEEAA